MANAQSSVLLLEHHPDGEGHVFGIDYKEDGEEKKLQLLQHITSLRQKMDEEC